MITLPINQKIFRKKIIFLLLRLGLPSALQMAVVNLSYLLVTGMLNGYGVAVAAASGIGLKVNSFAAMPCWAVGQAVTAMSGQNMGAGNIKRAGQTAKVGILLALFTSFFMVAGIQLWTEPLLKLFNQNPDVIAQGILYLRICCNINFLAYATMFILDSFATGVGNATFAMMNAILHSVVMRLVLSFLLAYPLGMGFIGIYWSECLSPVIPCLFGITYFLLGKWKQNKLI